MSNLQGIQFNTQSVSAIEAGLKTQFREPIEMDIQYIEGGYVQLPHRTAIREDVFIEKYARYKIGETVFAQEEFAISNFNKFHPSKLVYKELINNYRDGLEWQPASEMTEAQSRIKLKIKSIKIERLHDISEKDCIAEGVWCDKCENGDTTFWKGERHEFDSSQACCPKCKRYTEGGKHGKTLFQYEIWNNLPYPPKYQWAANPLVEVYEFEKVEEER